MAQKNCVTMEKFSLERMEHYHEMAVVQDVIEKYQDVVWGYLVACIQEKQ